MLTSTTGLEKIKHLISTESVPLLCYKYLREKKTPTTKASNGVTCCDMSSKSLIVCKAITRQNFLRVPHLATKAQLFAIIDLKYKRAVNNN